MVQRHERRTSRIYGERVVYPQYLKALRSKRILNMIILSSDSVQDERHTLVRTVRQAVDMRQESEHGQTPPQRLESRAGDRC